MTIPSDPTGTLAPLDDPGSGDPLALPGIGASRPLREIVTFELVEALYPYRSKIVTRIVCDPALDMSKDGENVTLPFAWLPVISWVAMT